MNGATDDAGSSVNPEVSVIIPTYNRRPVLERALEALRRQTVASARFEIVVVDDGSTDDTADVGRQWTREMSSQLLFLHQPNQGANAARNHALRHARGRILLFLNDDTIGVPSLLEEHLNSHARHPAEPVAVLGRMTLSAEIRATPLTDLHLDSCFRLIEGRSELDWKWFFTCNISVKRSFIMAHGPFAEGLRWHEDLELAERLRYHGLNIVYNPQALGYHYHPLTEEGFLRMARLEGEALVTWYRMAPHLHHELAGLGLTIAQPFRDRIRYWAGDVLTHPTLFPHLLLTARWLGSHNRPLARALYRKLYQSTKRRTIYGEMKRHESTDC